MHERGRKSGGAVQGQPQLHKVPGQPGLQKTPSQKEKKNVCMKKATLVNIVEQRKVVKKITRNNILFAPIWGQSLPQDCSKRLASKQPSTLSSVNICMSMFTKQNKQPGEAQPSGIMLFKSNLVADSCLCSLGIPS